MNAQGTRVYDFFTSAVGLEIHTQGGHVGILFPDVEVRFSAGQWTVTGRDNGQTFSGTSEVLDGAFLVLLADRLGMTAVVTMKPDLEV